MAEPSRVDTASLCYKISSLLSYVSKIKYVAYGDRFHDNHESCGEWVYYRDDLCYKRVSHCIRATYLTKRNVTCLCEA